MHNIRMVRVVALCAMASLIGTTGFAQSARQIEIKVITDQDEPLADATVLVRPFSLPSMTDEFALNDKPPAVPHTLATTDAAGLATVDVTKLLGDEADAPMSVSVWKVGYGAQSVNVQKKAELRCWPVRKRTVQIVDAQGQPLKGLRVEHSSGSEALLDKSQMQWWTDQPTVTDEFGLATLDAHASGLLTMTISEPDGTVHRASVNDINRFNGRKPDLRDLSIIRLKRHGNIEGQMPAEFAQEFGVRVLPDFRTAGLRFGSGTTSLNSQAQVEQDGHFRFNAVGEGPNWVVVYRREPQDSSKGTPPTRQPVALHRVDVEAGKTANINIGTVPVAKVTGRVVCPEATSNFSKLRLIVSHSTASETSNRSAQFYPVERVECRADGSFECWLPEGRYQLTAATYNPWRANTPLVFAIGAGAATIATADLRLTEYKTAKVTWLHDYRSANSMLSVGDNRLIFRSKEREIGDCLLTADGYGTAYLMPGEELTHIARGGILPTGQSTASAFTDRDPSENFDLELNMDARGTASNIALRGRVVDGAGKGIGRIPVTITLAYESTSSAAGRPTMQTGSQLLDVVMSERDGRYQIPPRQLLSRLTIPGGTTANEAKFIFTISTPANPQPIEARKVYTCKPDAWNEVEIEFPDLVIDSPLGGNRLTGQVLDADGKPSAGELLRLADKRHLVRTLSDRDGQFAIEDLAGPTWLLRESDWSIRALSDYGQPITCKFGEKATVPADGRGWKRMDRDERIKLAKELLQAVPVPGGAMAFAQVNAPVSDEFYLTPDRTFDQLLLAKGAKADLLRMQFVSFWSNLSEEKMRALDEAMSQNYYRVQLLLMLADRHPSVEAYEKVMQAIEYPTARDGRMFMSDGVIDIMANVGVKLHAHGALGPSYRDKIRQFLEKHAIEAAKVQPNPAGVQGLPNINRLNQERPWLNVCRALLDPGQFASGVLEQLAADATELTSEERMAQNRDLELFMKLFPLEFARLPAERMSMSDEVLASAGTIAPLNVLAAIKQGMLPADTLRVVSTAALISNHPDAEQTLREGAKLMLRSESTRPRLPTSFFGMVARQPDLAWYQAAKQKSPELGRLVAWNLAHDYLSGKYADNSITVLPARERAAPQILSTAYCLNDDFPELAHAMAQHLVPRLLASTEQEFGLTFTRNGDFSVAAWFDPQATTALVIKLKKRIDEERKQAGGARDASVFVKENELASLRFTCLRGLLLDQL